MMPNPLLQAMGELRIQHRFICVCKCKLSSFVSSWGKFHARWTLGIGVVTLHAVRLPAKLPVHVCLEIRCNKKHGKAAPIYRNTPRAAQILFKPHSPTEYIHFWTKRLRISFCSKLGSLLWDIQASRACNFSWRTAAALLCWLALRSCDTTLHQRLQKQHFTVCKQSQHYQPE